MKKQESPGFSRGEQVNDWTRAACTDIGPAVFDSTAWADHVAARRICDRCPVRADCHALACHIAATTLAGSHRFYGAPDGTWGGLLWCSGRVARRSRPSTTTQETA